MLTLRRVKRRKFRVSLKYDDKVENFRTKDLSYEAFMPLEGKGRIEKDKKGLRILVTDQAEFNRLKQVLNDLT